MLFIYVLFTLFQFSVQLENTNIIYVIISQNNYYSQQISNTLKQTLYEDYRSLGLNKPKIYVSKEDFNVPGDWTLTPLISPILNITQPLTEWIILLEERTQISVELLLNTLRQYDFTKDIWIGHALHDKEATIVHHFAFYENPTFFKYPNIGSGIALSIPLLKKLESYLKQGLSKQLDFHIDPSHEFAHLIYNMRNDLMLRHDNSFCCKKGPNCATYPRKFKPCGCVDVSTIFFAIKTCKRFHENRVTVVKNTWYNYAKHKMFFSDVEDSNIPTVSLNVANTEQGHCQKTMEILKYTLKEFQKNPLLKWLALIDDDTILSVSRIANVTTCYNNDSQPFILGERYRFGIQGFDYPTGGAGILFNVPALQILASKCTCPRPDSPDDMVVGICALELGIELVYIPQMHQARPDDYAFGRLATNDAVTFHKHWMNDPQRVYEKWFLADDSMLPLEPDVKLEL